MSLAALSMASPAEAQTAGYDSGFFIQSEDKLYKLKIEARMQARYTFASIDEGLSRSEESAFSIPRARLKLSGHAFTKDLTYAFQSDFGRGFVSLKDVYIDYRLVKDALHLRVGQWKRPFSRQQITSSGNLEFVDRALTDRAFRAGRDIGIAIQNNYEKSPPFEWALGLFNGTGETPTFTGAVAVDPATGEGSVSRGSFTNVPTVFHPTWVARVGFNRGPVKGYSEADLEGGPLRLSVGASGLVDLDADDDDVSAIRSEIDFMLKTRGFSLSGAGYAATTQDGSSFGDQTFAAVGAHAQAGYVIGEHAQPALRYAVVRDATASTTTHEPLAAFNVYFYNHKLKWQTDGGPIITQRPGSNTVDARVRTQLQLAF